MKQPNLRKDSTGNGRPLPAKRSRPVIRAVLMVAIALAGTAVGWLQKDRGQVRHPPIHFRHVEPAESGLSARQLLAAANRLRLSPEQVKRLQRLEAEEARATDPILTALRQDAATLEQTAGRSYNVSPGAQDSYARYQSDSRLLANTRARFRVQARRVLEEGAGAGRPRKG